QLCRASRARRRAHRPLRRDRWARARDCRNRLRLRHFRGLWQARPRYRLQEARRHGRRRGDCEQAPVAEGEAEEAGEEEGRGERARQGRAACETVETKESYRPRALIGKAATRAQIALQTHPAFFETRCFASLPRMRWNGLRHRRSMLFSKFPRPERARSAQSKDAGFSCNACLPLVETVMPISRAGSAAVAKAGRRRSPFRSRPA